MTAIQLPSLRVAVVGAGMAGASLARRLADSGHRVALFDKSRGVGGRMATRRVTWQDPTGAARDTSFDHGAPGFTARSVGFRQFAEDAVAQGWLKRWAPEMAPGSYETLEGLTRWVPVPDMPALCRRLQGQIPLTLGRAVDALVRTPQGWRIESAGEVLGEGFDQVVLAMPPAQAAVLLQPHRADWSQLALRVPMQPCWTLMGVADAGAEPPSWEAAWPQRGPLAWIVRNECKPGRDRAPGSVHWVVHAMADWSRTHLESPAAEVQAALQAALADWLRQPVSWRHVAVHRWLYAASPRAEAATPSLCWWDAAHSLGVCGDYLGGAGVEGAWRSAMALADVMIHGEPPVPEKPVRKPRSVALR